MKPKVNSLLPDAVKSMRKIREEISSEISDMTFAEERAFLDSLLAGKDDSSEKGKLKKAASQPN